MFVATYFFFNFLASLPSINQKENKSLLQQKERKSKHAFDISSASLSLYKWNKINNTMGVTLLSPFYRWLKWSLGCTCNLPQLRCLESFMNIKVEFILPFLEVCLLVCCLVVFLRGDTFHSVPYVINRFSWHIGYYWNID